MKSLKQGLFFAALILLSSVNGIGQITSGSAITPKKKSVADKQKPSQISADYVDVSGTSWRYMDEDDDCTIYFNPSGALETSRYTKEQQEGDTWWQEGKTIHLSYTNGYSNYEGTFRGKDKITGSASNINDASWTFEMTRILDYSEVSGTLWNYTDEDASYEIYFNPNGNLESSIYTEEEEDGDTWSQDGGTVNFEYTFGYAKYTGTFQGKDKIVGSATNVKDLTWTFELTRSGGYVDMAGTTWEYTDEDGWCTLYFNPNGNLENSNYTTEQQEGDSWSQEGSTVLFQYTNGYSKYTGSFDGTERITGSAINVNDLTWTFEMKRKY